MAFSSLTVIHVNVNGLRSREETVKRCLRKHPLAVMSLNDTRLDEDSEYEVPEDYKFIATRRTTETSGGVALLVPKSFISRADYRMYSDHGLDAAAVNIDLHGHKVKVGSYYNHPPGDETIRNLRPDGFKYFFQDRRIEDPFDVRLLVGDLNANHEVFGSSTTDTAGRDLDDIVNDMDLKVLNVGKPTYGDNVLDYAIVNRNMVKPRCKVIDLKAPGENPTDHRALKIQFLFPSNQMFIAKEN